MMLVDARLRVNKRNKVQPLLLSEAHDGQFAGHGNWTAPAQEQEGIDGH